jgi:hypothetical protein
VGARAWELKRGWLRAGAAVTGLVFTVLTSVLYLLLFPFALIEKARARNLSPSPRGGEGRGEG